MEGWKPKRLEILSHEESASEGLVSAEERTRLAYLEEWEQQCTPEQMKRIIDKVQDLDRRGIAYSRVMRLLQQDFNFESATMKELEKCYPEQFEKGIEKEDRRKLYNASLFPLQMNSS